MTIEMVETSSYGEAIMNGSATLDLSAGKTIQIRQNESGSIANELDEKVPAGKKWTVTIGVRIAETADE